MTAHARPARQLARVLAFVLLLLGVLGPVHASVGDRLPEFRECVQVRRRDDLDWSLG
jgi:hypothetical protein